MLANVSGGERGIRTPERVTPSPHFECGAINHSAISPEKFILPNRPLESSLRGGGF